MSRRCFMAAATAAAAAVPALAAKRAQPDAGPLAEYIDLASLRPKPDVRICGAIVRRPPPYWLGWPGTSYDLEGHKKHYDRAFENAAKKVGVTWEQTEPALETDAAVDAFAARMAAEKPDAVLLHLQHLDVWAWAEKIANTGVPTIVFAPIGTAFTGHVLRISRKPGVHVISSMDTAPVEQAMRMVRAKKQFARTNLLVVHGNERKEEELVPIGTRLKHVPRPTMHELFAQMPETDEVHEVARAMRKGAEKIVEPTRQDCINSARSYITAKRLLKNEGCNALTTDCLGMVSTRVVPTPPCMAATMFQDAGVTYGCEADVLGALSLMLTSYLFDKPGFMNDPVPETHKNLLIAAHCTSGTRLNGWEEKPEPYILRSHSESGIGVSNQVLWKEGQTVSLVRFSKPDEIIVDTGEVVANVDTPPAGGCRTNFEIAMRNVEDARDVAGFHQVVCYGDHQRDVEAFCQMWGFKHVHSPEHPPAV